MAQQKSQALVAFGAIKGAHFDISESWRLLASQWLHVNFKHMILNVAIIAIVGRALEGQMSPWKVVALGLLGGALGQLATTLLNPEAYISGASQAYLTLCGLAIILLPKRLKSIGFWTAIFGIGVSLILDIFVSEVAHIKIGHVVGLVTGIILGLIFKPQPAA